MFVSSDVGVLETELFIILLMGIVRVKRRKKQRRRKRYRKARGMSRED